MLKKYLPWIVCLTASLFFFYEILQLNMFNALSISLMRDYDLSSTQLGWLSSAYFYANLFFLIPAGMILERVSTRKMLLFACTVVTLATFAFAMTHSLKISVLCRALIGLGNCIAFLSCMRLATRWFEPKHLALVMGLIVTIAMLGGVVAQAPLAYLVQHLQWREAVMTVGALGVLIIVLMFLFVRDKKIERATLPATNLSALFSGFKRAMSSWSNWCCGFYMALLNLPLMILGALWGNLYLSQTRGLSAIDAASITGMLFFGMIIGPPVIGMLSDKWQRRRLPMLVFALLTLIMTLFVMYISTSSITLMMILFLVLGICLSAQTLSYPTLAATNSPDITSMAMTIPALCFNLSVAVSQPLFGWLMHFAWQGKMFHGTAFYSLRNYHDGFILLLVASIIAAFLSLMIKEPFAKTHQQKLRDPLFNDFLDTENEIMK